MEITVFMQLLRNLDLEERLDPDTKNTNRVREIAERIVRESDSDNLVKAEIKYKDYCYHQMGQAVLTKLVYLIGYGQISSSSDIGFYYVETWSSRQEDRAVAVTKVKDVLGFKILTDR